MEVSKHKKTERTTQQYELLPGYPKPPLIHLPDKSALRDPSSFGFKSNSFSRPILHAVLSASGMYSFREKLPELLEDDLRYTDFRGSVVYAPAVVASLSIRDDSREPTAFERAATLILSAYQIYDELMEGSFKPDRLKDQILEMGHYPNFFSTNLVIKNNRAYNFKSAVTERITVIAKGRFFLLDTTALLTRPSVPALAKSLEHLWEKVCKENTRELPGPGILSAAANKTQYAIFKELEKDDQNRQSLEELKHSFLTLCLDIDHRPENYEQATRLTHVDNALNRWYHSSFQIVVFGNAKAAFVCNFSCNIAGNGMTRMGKEMQNRGEGVPLHEDDDVPAMPFKELLFNIPLPLHKRAVADVKRLQYSEEATFSIDHFGSDTFNRLGLKPVETFVVALQIAMLKMIGKTANIFQFLSTTRYCCMDVTTALVSTDNVKRAAESITRGTLNREEVLHLLSEAVDSQKTVCRSERNQLPALALFELLSKHTAGIRKLLNGILINLMFILFRVTGIFNPVRREILLSHPQIFPEIPVFGRPGAKLPYVKYFGLHYMIQKSKIDITVMPGISWNTPNRRLISEIESALKQIERAVKS